MDQILPHRRRPHDADPPSERPRSQLNKAANSNPPSRRPNNDNNKDSNNNHHRKGPMPAWQGHLVAMSGEFVGTIMFLFFALAATQIANNITPPTSPSLDQLLFISLAFGFSLAVTAWVFYRISGGLFNPAVTLAMILTGTLPTVRGLLLLPVQFIAGIVSAALVACMFPGPLRSETRLTGGTTAAQGCFIEMFLTAELCLTVLFLAAEKQKSTFIAPVGIGLALFVAELAGVFYTGGSLNPARSFGPAVANRSFPSYHWVYWVGPALGAIISAGYYKFAKFFNYEEANPGQDDSGEEVVRVDSNAMERKSTSRGGSRGHA